MILIRKIALAVILLLSQLNLESQNHTSFGVNDLANIFVLSFSETELFLAEKEYILAHNKINEDGLRSYQFYNKRENKLLLIYTYKGEKQTVRLYSNDASDYFSLKKDAISKNYSEESLLNKEFGVQTFFQNNNDILVFVSYLNDYKFQYGIGYTKYDLLTITWN